VKPSGPKERERREQLGCSGQKLRRKKGEGNFLFLLFLKAFQIHFQKNLNSFSVLVKTTQHKNSNAAACMHNHVARPYSEF
jgi:hypothetical protein